MKKLTTLLMCMVCVAGQLMAQYYYVPYTSAGTNPGGLNTDDEYPVGGGLSTTWTTVLGPSASPAWSTQQSIPFAFSFDGNPVSTFYVSNSGVLTFSTTVGAAPSFTNATIPDAAIPDNSVMIWGIEGTGTNDNVVKKTFGTAPNRQHWIFFSSYTITGNSTGWQYWSIVLEETTNNIFIVDQRNNSTDVNVTAGIQINSSSAVMIDNTANLDAVAGSNFTSSDNGYYQFIQGTQPQFDIASVAVTMNAYLAQPNAPFTVSGTLLNAGTSAITSAEISYTINGGAAVSGTLSGLNIAPGATHDFNHPVSWNPGSTGVYTVAIFPTTVNGNPDGNAGNNNASMVVNVVAAMTQLTPLFEEFTSSTCAPCAANNPTFDAMLAPNVGNFTCVKYQMDWPGTGDPYYNADGETRRAFYAVSSIPDLWVDGALGIAPAQFTQADFDDEYAKPAFVSMNAQYSATGTQFNVSVTLNPLINVTGSLKAFIAVVENPTIANATTNGETEFFYVEQKMFPNGSGVTVSSLVAGTPVTINQSYDFNSATHNVENFNNTKVAVWLQNMTTKEVYQSSFATKVVGVQEIEASNGGIIAVYPNPANESATLEYRIAEDDVVDIRLINALGQQVFEQTNIQAGHGSNRLTFDLSELPSGSYFVDLRIGSNHYRDHLFRN